MASNYTPNYNLCQWAASDKVLHTEFNADNAKIDAALAAKADTSALNSLKTGKADQSALDSLTDRVRTQEIKMERVNCRIAYGTYKGTGEYGPDHPNTISFSRMAMFVCISCDNNPRKLIALNGQPQTWTGVSTPIVTQELTWGRDYFKWYTPIGDKLVTAADQFNSAESTYHYFAILKLEV